MFHCLLAANLLLLSASCPSASTSSSSSSSFFLLILLFCFFLYFISLQWEAERQKQRRVYGLLNKHTQTHTDTHEHQQKIREGGWRAAGSGDRHSAKNLVPSKNLKASTLPSPTPQESARESLRISKSNLKNSRKSPKMVRVEDCRAPVFQSLLMGTLHSVPNFVLIAIHSFFRPLWKR